MLFGVPVDATDVWSGVEAALMNSIRRRMWAAPAESVLENGPVALRPQH
jgi:hypothetical protein